MVEIVTQLQLAAENHLLPAAETNVMRLGRFLLQLIEEGNRHSQMLLHAATVRSMEQDLLRLLAAAVQVPLKESSFPAASKRRRGVESALEYMHYADQSALTVPQLRKASGVACCDYSLK
jgi:hypothetical protein